MTTDATTAFARTLVDELWRGGVRHAVVAPGSRSTPLALALASDDRVRTHVVLDERSAAFFALGIGRATARPAVVLCTSGTAAAHLHPAVLEADLACVPMIVCTADRPPELRDVGAPQTVDQVGLYGGALRWASDVEVPDERPGAGIAWRSLGSRAVIEALGPPAGPVHLNLPTREPLVPTGAPAPLAPGRPDDAPWTRAVPPTAAPASGDLDRLAALVAGSTRGLVAAGWGAGTTPEVLARFAEVTGWPVLADPLSGLRHLDRALAGGDLVARDPEVAAALRPDLVVRLGAPVTSAATQRLVEGVPTILVDPDRALRDPARDATERVVADPDALLVALTERAGTPGATTWWQRWQRVDAAARAAADAALDGDDEPFEGRVARDVLATVPDGATLVVGSSMPVRDLDTFAGGRAGVRVVGNRGANGIDGFVSSALGVAAGSAAPVVALTGDLGFLHDAGGLLGATARDLDVTFVVVDNDGGGIFSFLAQAELPRHFETLFATPHGIDLAALASAYHVPTNPIARASALAPVLERAVAEGGVRVLHVRTDRERNVARHRALWQVAAQAARRALELPS